MKNPSEVFISFTTKCNLQCKHCYSNSIINGKTINEEEMLKTLQQIKPLRLVISGGEPLIELKRLKKFLEDYKNKYKISSYIVLATNSTLFNKENLNELKEYVDRFQISLDALSKEKFIEIRGVDLLEKTIEKIKLAKSMGLDVQIAFSMFKTNLEEVENIINFCQENKIKRINVLRPRPTGRSKPELTIKQIKETYLKFLELSKDKDLKIIIHDPLANVLGLETECTAAKEIIAIDIEGNFKPCPLFSLNIKGNFEDIWNNNEIFNRIRNTPKECQNCMVKSCNGGCKADSYNMYNELKKDPWCMKI